MTSLNATRDSRIIAEYPNNNYGNQETIGVYNAYSGLTAWGLVGYDISDLSGKTIANATLLVFISGADINCDFERITASWVESTVTWNNKPASTTTHKKTVNVIGNFSWIEIDLTELLQDAANASLNTFDFYIKAVTSGEYKNFYAKEYTQVPNTLYLTYEYGSPINVYVNSSTGNDSNSGLSSGSPKLTFSSTYTLVASGGTIHVCNSGADFSAETVTLNKSFSIDLNGASGNFYGPKAS